MSVFYPGDNDYGQGHDGQKHHDTGDDHVHDILKRSGVAAVRKRKHPVSDSGDPFHRGKQPDSGAEQFSLLSLYTDADKRHAHKLARIV